MMNNLDFVQSGSGFIDFREYVIGMSLVSQAAVTEKTVKLAFKVRLMIRLC